ncbi:hypothetical protein A5821_002749 [Enterococcus sp. 7F3_DIV0205]|uniref:WxL domain-containing protein n=1 Tax=Candidatus Enterococcus palustris TaxID=1834189 RepID=A0AAQ3WBK2_9ENTE|nr:hypothetical protein [Enterococcus sp. 7F3_DIV0205]OTN83183.1 hypothetical protein A5821_003106 [Enterococcus sp. 7F3_DIV0205]
MKFIKRFNLWMLIIFLVVSPLCQSPIHVFAETLSEQTNILKIHKNEKEQAVVSLPQVRPGQEVTIKTNTVMDIVALEQEQSILKLTNDEENHSISFIYQGTAPFQLYFDVDQVQEQEIIVEQNQETITYQLQLDESFTETSTSELTSSETEDTNQSSSETSSTVETSETIGSSEPEKNSENQSSTSNSTESSSTSTTTEQARKPETRSGDLVSEIAADRDAGWKVQLDKQTTLATSLSSGSQISYGFATEEDLFLTNIFLTNENGQRVDYRNESNSSNGRGIRFYSFEKAGEYTPVEKVAMSAVSVKENQIRAYGEFTLDHNLIYSYKVVVRVTLSSNSETGDIQKQIEIKRVDKPLLGDPQPMNVGFSEVVDTKLNGKDSGDVAYIGNGRGLSIANDPYQVMFKVGETSNVGTNPDKWGAAKGTYLDLSIGIHWWYRYAEPGDFFKSRSIIGGEVHGLEEKNGQPGEIVDYYSDAAVAMMWNKQKVKPQEKRTMSYTIHLDEINNPKINLQSDIPASLLEGKIFENISGTVESELSSTVDMLYAIDDEPYTKFEEIENGDQSGKQKWSIDKIDLSAYKTGKHTLTFLAQDSNGNLSEKVTRTFRIVSKDTKYVFDSTVTNTNGLLSKVHPGDRLHYEIYLENRGKNIYFRWENEFSKYLTLDEASLHIENKRDPKPDVQIQGNKMIYNGAMALNEVITFSFDAIVKDESLGVKLASIVNKASFYEKGSTTKPLVKSEISIANEGTVTNFPKPYLEGQLLNKDIKEEDELLFEGKIGNSTLAKDVDSGAWKQVQYVFPEEEGLVLKEIQILDKNNQPLPDSQVECGIVSETDGQQVKQNYRRMAIARFKKDILPQEEYHIRVKATAAKDSSKLSEPIIVHTSAFGIDKTEESVELEKEIKLPKVQPKEMLTIAEVTGELNFGEWTIKREKQKRYAEDLSITIQDTRSGNNSWSLQVSSEIKNESGDTLPLFFEEGNQKQSLEAGVIISHKGMKELKFGEKSEQKIYAELSPNMTKGHYQGTVSWNLMDVP